MDFSTIDFDTDPVLQQADKLDERVDSLFRRLDSASSDEDKLVIDEDSSLFPTSPSEFLSTSPSTMSISSTVESKASSPSKFPEDKCPAGSPEAKNVTCSQKRSHRKAAVITEDVPPPPPPKRPKISRQLKWESPDEKIHKYNIKKQAANVKYKEYTRRFIAVKTASRKIDTREPLPKPATVHILQVRS